MPNGTDFNFATSSEIAKELGGRLRAQRLSQGLTQTEVAERAGVSRLTVLKIEANGQTSFESFIRLTQALGLVDELMLLFSLKIDSIAQMERAEAFRRRAPRRRS